MKKIIDFSVNNKFAVWLLTAIIVATGLFTGLNMKQELMPDITFPNISISTSYPGAAPDEVAEEITVPIEQKVRHLNGVEIVSSSSNDSFSSVQLEFDFEKDMDNAASDVKEALEDIALPEDASKPQVSRISLSALPVLALSVSDESISMEELTGVVEENILPAIQGVNGISDVQITGQQLEKVNLTFDEDKLAKYGLDEDTIEQIIQGSDVTFPLGLINFDGEVKNVVIDGNVDTLDDLKKLRLPAVPEESEEESAPSMEGEMPEGFDPSEMSEEELAALTDEPMTIPTITLEELADIEVVSELESISRTNGEDSIGMQIVKAPEANTVEVVNLVQDLLPVLEEDYGITAVSSFDQGEPIEEAVSSMLEKGLFGIIFAIIIILLFLRSFKTTIISIISIPMSLLIALFLLDQMDISLNILTLGALTVAIGRVIDDSIVVMENIFRRLKLPDEKLKGKALIREATMEMFVPIASSTIVTIAVFLPIGLVSGQAGELFLPFALAVAFALAASLLVAVTIVPMLAHSLFKKELYKNPEEKRKQVEEKPKVSKLAKMYKPILEWVLNHKFITFGSATVLLVASLFLIPLIGASFLPDEEENMIMATFSPEPGQSLEQVEKIALNAEDYLTSRDGITTYQYSLGGGSPLAMMGMGGGNSALFFIEYDDDFKGFKEEVNMVIEDLNEMTDRGTWNNLDIMGMGGGLELYVYGNSKEDIEDAVNQIMPFVEEHKDLEKADSSISEAYEEYKLVANQEKLSEFGLSAAQVGMNFMSMEEDSVLTTVKLNKQDVEVFVTVEEKNYQGIEEIEEVEVETALGNTITIGDVVDVKEGTTPDTVSRRNDQMYASVSAEITSKDVAGVSADIEKSIEDLTFASGVTAEFGGVTEQIDETFTQLGLAMLAAVAIVYFVLVVTFGGALAPFAILFSLPFTIIGSLVALWIAGEPLTVSAMIGALMLIGIVVTNAIVLIDRVIRKEKEGLPTRDAIIEAGMTRLRPILMTALATIGALIPLALFDAGGGALISKGVGVTVIGGLISSTVLTLLIVPIVYEVFARFMKSKVEED